MSSAISIVENIVVDCHRLDLMIGKPTPTPICLELHAIGFPAQRKYSADEDRWLDATTASSRQR
jgi:hypothetical protein